MSNIVKTGIAYTNNFVEQNNFVNYYNPNVKDRLMNGSGTYTRNVEEQGYDVVINAGNTVNPTVRITDMNFDGLEGTFMVEFDAYATANIKVTCDVCDRTLNGLWLANLTTSKQHFSGKTTAIINSWNKPSDIFNGFFDMEFSIPSSAVTVHVSNLVIRYIDDKANIFDDKYVMRDFIEW